MIFDYFYHIKLGSSAHKEISMFQIPATCRCILAEYFRSSTSEQSTSCVTVLITNQIIFLVVITHYGAIFGGVKSKKNMITI